MDRGRLLFEYRPPRAHPIVYAGLLLFSFVFVTGSLENLLREARPSLYAAYGAPVLTLLGWLALTYPSDVRIHQEGIAPSRPLLLRWWRPFARWSDLAAVYPSYYDVTGAFVSPFASSDGKVTQMGLALEWPDGRVETVRFTPSRFTIWQAESAGYVQAMEAVRHAFAGRPLVPEAQSYSPEEAEAMVARASRPFLPFWAIVFLFASAAPVLWVLTYFGASVAWALPVSLLAPLGVSLRSFAQSRRRNDLLNRLSKAAEHRRASSNGPQGS